jgi:hypothetical protein
MVDKTNAPNAVKTFKKFRIRKDRRRPEINYIVTMIQCCQRAEIASPLKTELFVKVVI